MTLLAALFSALAVMAALLLIRLYAASRRLRTLLRRLDVPSDTARAVTGHLDALMLSRGDHRGPACLEIPAREPHDPYRSVEELLDCLETLAEQNELASREKLIKGLYQLQNALALPDALLRDCLQPILGEFKKASFMGRPVGRIECINRGDLLNTATMWPLSRGTRVRQPLGLVVRDAEGRIISKAKVLCE